MQFAEKQDSGIFGYLVQAARQNRKLAKLRAATGKRTLGLAALVTIRRRVKKRGFGRKSERMPKVYGQIGSLQVRLARGTADIRSAQRLRYDVFYREMSAQPTITAQFRQRDEDPYDAVCDQDSRHKVETRLKKRWHTHRTIGLAS